MTPPNRQSSRRAATATADGELFPDAVRLQEEQVTRDAGRLHVEQVAREHALHFPTCRRRRGASAEDNVKQKFRCSLGCRLRHLRPGIT